MRRKRVELQEAVIVAARNWVKVAFDPYISRPYGLQEDDLIEAVQALDDHDAAEMTGQGAKWVHGSPKTSREAAELAALAQNSARRLIVTALMMSPLPALSDDHLERKIGRSHQTISSARNWLVEAGWVRDSGKRAITRAGREAIAWELTPAALRQIGDL